MSVVLPIETDDRFRKYTASAGQTVFAVPFPFQDNADIAAMLQDAETGDYTELSSTLYTLTGAGTAGGGSLAFSAGRTEDEVILILGRAVLERLSSVVRDGAFSSKLIDGELDRNRIIQQELARDVERSLKMEFGGGPGLTIGEIADGQTLMKSGARIVPGPAAADISGAQGYAEAAWDAANRALESARSVAFVVVTTRAQLKAVDTTHFVTAYVKDAEDWFDFRAGDYTARVAADVGEGIVIKANAVSAAAGAWQRRKYFDYDSRQFSGTISQAILAIETVGGGVLRIGGGVTAPTLPTNYFGTVVEFDGPFVDVNFGQTSGDENVLAKRAWKMQHSGSHPDEILSGFHLQSAVNGSGKNGPTSADVLLSLSHVKKNAPSGAVAGEIDGQYIIVRQGGPAPTSRQTSSDHAGLLIGSTNFGNCGHGFIIEGSLSNLDAVGNVLYSLQAQVGGIETNWLAFNPDGTLSGTPLGTRYVFGFNAHMVTGQGDVAYLVEGTANWKSAFRVTSVESLSVFDIRNTGEFWQGSGSNRIKHAHSGGSAILTTGSDVTFATFSPASGIIAGDYVNADAVRIRGGAAGTQTTVEVLSVNSSANLQVLAKGTGYVMVGRSTNTLGFYGSSGAVKPTVTGSKGGNAALTSLIAQLVSLNLIADSTT